MKVRWFIDKQSRVPLYLQLKDLLQYYIATGAIAQGAQLPTVNQLAGEVGLAFETVRKAYTTLEQDGLVEATRGRGTHVVGYPARHDGSGGSPFSQENRLQMSLRHTLSEMYDRVHDKEWLQERAMTAIDEITKKKGASFAIFTECNKLQTESFSRVLTDSLKIDVQPVIVEHLAEAVKEAGEAGRLPAAVITTGFHFREVRALLCEYPIVVDFLITRMSPQTRRAIDSFGKNARFGFICRNRNCIAVHRDVLTDELGIPGKLACHALSDPDTFRLLEIVDVLLVSPAVFEEVRKIAPADLPIFNVFDWVDPLSLDAIKTRISNEVFTGDFVPAIGHD